MGNKVLMLAAKANMIQQFNHRNIKILQSMGYEVHVATNMIDFGSMSAEENERLKIWMDENNVIAHQVDFERRMGSLKGNLHSIKQLKQIFSNNEFSFIHVHSPLGGILGRIVAKQFHVPVIYTAHGFHFFKGGPKSSWMIFYPLEWIFSFITDTLITINDADYALAKHHMHANKLEKINGIGVDVKGAGVATDDEICTARKTIRDELDIPENAFLILSVGEVSDLKNHKLVLEAVKEMSPELQKNIYYIIAGTGNKGEELLDIANSFGFENNFKLIGYRTDVHVLNYACDLFVFPSLREGLGVAGLNAAIDRSYVIGTNKGGVSEYVKEGINGELIDPHDHIKLKEILEKCIETRPKVSVDDIKFLNKFDMSVVDEVMKNTYAAYK